MILLRSKILYLACHANAKLLELNNICWKSGEIPALCRNGQSPIQHLKSPEQERQGRRAREYGRQREERAEKPEDDPDDRDVHRQAREGAVAQARERYEATKTP